VIANLFLLAIISFILFATEVLGRLGLPPSAVVYYGLVMSVSAVAYTLVQRQVFAAHPGVSVPFSRWNVVGP